MLHCWPRRRREEPGHRANEALEEDQGETGSLLEPPEQAQPCQSPWLQLMRLRTSGVICAVLSHPVGGHLLPWQLETNVPSKRAVQFLQSHQPVGHVLFLRMRKNFPEAPERTSSYLIGQN